MKDADASAAHQTPAEPPNRAEAPGATTPSEPKRLKTAPAKYTWMPDPATLTHDEIRKFFESDRYPYRYKMARALFTRPRRPGFRQSF